ncbi:MAG: AbrB/MazE/SpoVT family DNA-binding domain-containing protein [Anaerolineaceae bacterium]|nr:AbrB/MazE/SpoVT family DNA-binding domain-containing protein [Anaerolineaceae bacterium]
MALVKIKKCGNSLGLRIPKATLERLGIRENDEVLVEIGENKIILTPVKKRKYDLVELLSGISSNNLHQEMN